MADTIDNLDGFNKNTLHNRPLDRGIIPGTRHTHRYSGGQNGSILSDHTQILYNIVGAGREGAYIGKSAKIITRLTVQTKAGNNLTDADKMGFRNEGPGLMWESLSLAINGGVVNAGQRADVTRHMKDTYLHTSGNIEGGGNPNYLNKVLADSKPAETELMTDGKIFEVVRPLDDLPFCSELDGLIPSFLNLRVEGTVGILKKMLSSHNARHELKFTLIETFLAIDWVEVEKVVFDDWTSSYLQRTLKFDTNHWYTHTETIAQGVTQYDSKSTITLPNVPNFILCQTYSQDLFPASADILGIHPFTNFWEGVRDFTISDNAMDIAHYRHLTSGKSELFMELMGLVNGINKTVPNYTNFTNSQANIVVGWGSGCFPKVYRAYDDILTQPTQPINYRVSINYENATTRTLVFYFVAMVRQGYLVTVDGVQTINLEK